MSTEALGTAVSGMSVAQARINTISRNIANASTDGYSRKTQGAIVGPTGAPFAAPVLRQVNEALALSIRESSGTLNKLDVTVQLLSQIETQFGRPEDNGSLPGVLQKLEGAFRDLQTSPEKSTLYSTLIGVADQVTHTFRQIYERALAVETDTSNRIEQAVSDVNATLEQLQDLNSSIASGGNGLDTTDLEDQRDAALLKLAGLMDFTSYKQSNGAVAIYSKQGIALLDNIAHPISVLNIATRPAPAPANPVVIRNGALGGLLAVRDTSLPNVKNQLDDMARALSQAFSDPPPPAAPPNGAGLELFNDGGGTPLDLILDPTQITGYARRITVNVALRADPTLIRGPAATPLGDTTVINRAVQLFSRTDIAFNAGLQSPGGIVQTATDFIAAKATARQDAEGGLDQQKALKESLQTKHSSLTGVNLDQEMAELIVFQQAYAANARMIQTSKDMLDALMQVR
jgi:flagellar hook-associated protein 1 FlgK